MSNADELKLKKLLDSGVLTEKEFNFKRKKFKKNQNKINHLNIKQKT